MLSCEFRQINSNTEIMSPKRTDKYLRQQVGFRENLAKTARIGPSIVKTSLFETEAIAAKSSLVPQSTDISQYYHTSLYGSSLITCSHQNHFKLLTIYINKIRIARQKSK